MSSGNPSHPRSADITRGKALVFSVVVVGLFFAAGEGILALVGVEPRLSREDPYVGFSSNVPLFAEAHGGGPPLFVTAPNKLPYFNHQQFPQEKGPGTQRVFCVGGSTTYGRPYADSTSFCGWLREFLRAADRSAAWEVINAGGISYASYRVTVLMEELARYEPDLIVVYSGHNEFLERRTYAAILDVHPALAWVDATLSRTRTYTLLESAIGALRDGSARGADAPRAVLSGEVSTLLDGIVGPDAFTRDDEVQRQILAHYRFNLGRMVQIAQRAGAAILFVTPASNLKDCSPFKSEPATDLGDAERERWSAAVRRGRLHRAEGRLREALVAFRTATAIDERHAGAHYWTGQVQYALGDFEGAEASLRRARDEDVCPLRALSPMPEIVRTVAREHRALLVDFEARLERRTREQRGHAVLGSEYFLDHVHPTIEAHRALALDILEQMRLAGMVSPGPDWGADAIAAVTQTVEDSLDRRAHGVALRNLAKVLSWAGKLEDAGRLALQALDHLGEDAESSFIAGTHASERGALEDAERHFRNALRLEPDYAKARNNLAIVLARQGRLEEAMGEYENVLRSDPLHANAHYNLGNAYLRSGEFERAIAHYRAALVAEPEDADAIFNLARVYSRNGDLARSAEQYEALLELRPEDQDAHFDLARVCVRMAQWERAARHLTQAVRLRPEDAGAHFELARVRETLGDRDAARLHYRAALARRPGWSEAEAAAVRLDAHARAQPSGG